MYHPHPCYASNYPEPFSWRRCTCPHPPPQPIQPCWRFSDGDEDTSHLNLGDSESTGDDGFRIRRVATENGITVFTSLDTVKVLLDVLEEITFQVSTIDA